MLFRCYKCKAVLTVNEPKHGDAVPCKCGVPYTVFIDIRKPSPAPQLMPPEL